MSSDANQRVRLQDVAEHAEVSKSIASRVLNGDPTVLVREETRARVLASARELSYRPHPVARALASSLTGALALLLPSFDNPSFVPIIRGAYRRARERGFILLSVEDDAEEGDEAFTELVRAGRIDGLLIASTLPDRLLLTALERYWIPHVFLNRAIPGVLSNVVFDVARASELALEHLASLGHHRLAHIAGPAEVEAARRRETAFVAAAAQRGLPDVAVQRSAFSEPAGLAAALRLLNQHPDVTGIYASSFLQALGVLQAAAGVGRRVPDDLSVLAYDNVTAADYTNPPLTTIAMPMEELGSTAVEMVLAQIGGEPPRNDYVRTPPKVIERGSTRALAQSVR